MQTANGTDIEQGGSDPHSPSRVVVPVEETPLSTPEASVAGAVSQGGEVVVTELVSVDDEEPLRVPEGEFDHHRSIIDRSVTAADGANCEPEGVVGVGRQRARIVSDVATTHDGDTILAGLGERPEGERFGGALIDSLRTATDCRLVYARHAAALSDPASLLVPVEDGPHAAATMATAGALAVEFDACLELLHVMDPDPSSDRRRRGEEILTQATDALPDGAAWDTWLLEADRVADTIIEQSDYYDGTVLGGPRRDRLQRFVFGGTTSAVQADGDTPVFTVWQGTPDPPRQRP